MLVQVVVDCPKEWWRRSQGEGQEFLQNQPPKRQEGRSTAPSWWSSSLRRPTGRRRSIQRTRSLVRLLQQIGTSCTDTASHSPSTWWCPPNLPLLSCWTVFRVVWRKQFGKKSLYHLNCLLLTHASLIGGSHLVLQPIWTKSIICWNSAQEIPFERRSLSHMPKNWSLGQYCRGQREHWVHSFG